MRVELHSITHCGFYERAEPNPMFGKPEEWSGMFSDWVRRRPNVAATKTFDPEDGEPTIYCAACAPDRYGDGFGLILWHGMPATESGVAYISMVATPNAVQASERRMPRNSIAGWPSYFWVLPRDRCIVALHPAGKIRNRGSGLPAVRQYLDAYLQRFSEYVELAGAEEASEDGGETRQILGWRAVPTMAARNDLYPRFDTRPVEEPCVLDVIRARCGEIRKLVQSVQVTQPLPEQRARLEQLLAISGWSTPYRAPEQDRLSFRWESDWQPDLAELESLIEEARLHPVTSERRDRVGVRFSGESRTYWLDRQPVHDEIELLESLERELTWSPEQLQEAWAEARGRVIRKLRSDGVHE